MALYWLAALLFLGYVLLRTSHRNYPPGPRSWLPLIGHRMLTKKLSRKLGSLQKALRHLSQEYKTDVLGLYLTGNYTVVIFGEKLARRVFLGKEFQGRPRNFFNTLRSMGTNKGITMTDGNLWHEQRSFLVKQLSEIGFGGDIMDSFISEEFQRLMKVLGEGKERTDLGGLLSTSNVNVLWRLVAGEWLSDRGDSVAALLRLMNDRTRAFDIAGGNITQMPWLRHVAPETSGYNLIVDINHRLRAIVTEAIESHKKTFRKDVTRDYIDAFLHEMYSDTREDSTFTDAQLMMMCLDLLIAGLQTTTHTIEFGVLALVAHRHVQERMRAELDSVLQPDELLSYDHRAQLPYTCAVIMEILRYCHVIPLFGPRRVLQDTSLNGYFIPKGTTIVMDMVSVRNDEQKWEDAEQFKPERFLEDSTEGKQFYPFSYGKRRCPGEVMARSVIFVFLAGLVRHYELAPVQGQEAPPLEPVPGITNTPRPYNLSITRRPLLLSRSQVSPTHRGYTAPVSPGGPAL